MSDLVINDVDMKEAALTPNPNKPLDSVLVSVSTGWASSCVSDFVTPYLFSDPVYSASGSMANYLRLILALGLGFGTSCT